MQPAWCDPAADSGVVRSDIEKSQLRPCCSYSVQRRVIESTRNVLRQRRRHWRRGFSIADVKILRANRGNGGSAQVTVMQRRAQCLPDAARSSAKLAATGLSLNMILNVFRIANMRVCMSAMRGGEMVFTWRAKAESDGKRSSPLPGCALLGPSSMSPGCQAATKAFQVW